MWLFKKPEPKLKITKRYLPEREEWLLFFEHAGVVMEGRVSVIAFTGWEKEFQKMSLTFDIGEKK